MWRNVNGCWVGARGIYNTTAGFGWKWSDVVSKWNESIFLGGPSIPAALIDQHLVWLRNVMYHMLLLASLFWVHLILPSLLRQLTLPIRLHWEYCIILGVVSGLIF